MENTSNLADLVEKLDLDNELEFQGFEGIVSKTVYLFLFEGLPLREIEKIISGSTRFKGFMPKMFMNYLGLASSTRNRGIFKGHSPREVVRWLRRSDDPALQRLAYYLELENQTH